MKNFRFVLASILMFPLCVAAVPTYTEIFSYPFTGQPGCNPSSKPLEGSDGSLYGTTARIFSVAPNHDDGAGLLYRINKDGTGYTVLHLFDGTTSPNASTLIQTEDGALWGTTADKYSGTVYKVNLDGSGFTTVHTLNAPPRGALLEASDGAIYGAAGGRNAVYREGDDPGLIYRINKDGTGFAVIRSFSWALPSQGWAPTGSLVEGADGFLYGATSRGGITDRGTVFRLSKDGKQYVMLYSFTGGTDGEIPHAGVIEASDSALYGTTGGYGLHGHGSIYRLNKDGSGFAVLRSSDPDTNGCPCLPEVGPPPATNGLVLEDLIEGSDGALYASGSEKVRSVISKIDKDGSGYTVLDDPRSIYDYASPLGVIEGSDGVLYGTTGGGGYAGNGTVFKISKSGTDYVELRAFDGWGARGIYPNGLVYGNNNLLVYGSDNVLYGASGYGGSNTVGAIYRINTDGSGFSVIHSFTGGAADGAIPRLFLHVSDGFLYGASSGGHLFRVNTDGSNFQVVHQFDAANDDTVTALIESTDGVLYGSAKGVWIPRYPPPNLVGSRYSTLFKMNKDGSDYQTFYTFPYDASAGYYLFGNGFGFALGNDGYIYGARNGWFEVFRFLTGGTGFETLIRPGLQTGFGPALFQGSDGGVYTSWPVPNIARLDNNSSNVTLLHNFIGEQSPRIFEGPDGLIYGSTVPMDGGPGTLFRLAKDGSQYSELFSFPMSPTGIGTAIFVKGGRDDFYGVTTAGGADGLGTIFRLHVPITEPWLTATSTWSTAVFLDWSYADPRVTAFVIERKAGDKGDFAQIATLDKEIREFTDTNATPSTKYVYRMRATDGVEYSDYSNEASISTPRQERTVTLVSVARCDGFVAEPTKKANWGGMAFPSSAGPAAIRAGDTSLNQQVKGILSFRTFELPDGATILSANVMLKRGIMYGDPLSSLGRCVVDINGGSGFGKTPTLEPMDFQALPSKKRAALLNPIGDDSGWYLAQVDPKCLQFISTTAVTQFRVYFEVPDNGDLAPDYIGWYSGECPIPENRPVLQIMYR